MARPKESNPRTQRFAVRLTEEEAATLQRRAKRAGVSVSRYGRVTLLGNDRPAPNGTNPPPAGIPDEMDDARRYLAEQVRRVGVNLNQVARQLNSGGDLRSEQALLDLIAEIRAYMDEARGL